MSNSHTGAYGIDIKWKAFCSITRRRSPLYILGYKYMSCSTFQNFPSTSHINHILSFVKFRYILNPLVNSGYIFSPMLPFVSLSLYWLLSISYSVSLLAADPEASTEGFGQMRPLWGHLSVTH